MVSLQSGMGAIPYSGGVGFRVWAPNVDGVNVAGDFNNWSETTHPLEYEEAGYWSTDVSEPSQAKNINSSFVKDLILYGKMIPTPGMLSRLRATQSLLISGLTGHPLTFPCRPGMSW